MLESLSPYQLLKASSVKTPFHTPCDAFEKRNAATQAIEPPPLPIVPPVPSPDTPAAQIPPQFKRTHYIADIHSRHSAAQRYLPD